MLFLSNFEQVQCNLEIILILTHADKFFLELQKIKKKTLTLTPFLPVLLKLIKRVAFY